MSTTGTIPGVVNQVTGISGEGDVDDCAVATSYWCARYADPAAVFPPVPTFRAAAGNPDDPSRPDGLTLAQVVRGSRATWPHLTIERYSSTSWDELHDRLTAGWAANLGVISAELPASLRFGFLGAHAIGVIYRDGYLVANPLARNGSAPLPCPRATLGAAARRLGGGTILAALYQPWEAGTVKFTIADGTPAWGVATTTQATRAYRWDGTRVELPAGTKRAVYGNAVVDGKPCYVIRTGGAQEGHYLIAAHCSYAPRDFDEKHRVTLQIEGHPDYVTEV